MRYYDDKKNKNGIEILFFVFQAVMFFIVYGFVYTSFVAVKLAGLYLYLSQLIGV